jgi:hypothetical protein
MVLSYVPSWYHLLLIVGLDNCGVQVRCLVPTSTGHLTFPMLLNMSLKNVSAMLTVFVSTLQALKVYTLLSRWIICGCGVGCHIDFSCNSLFQTYTISHMLLFLHSVFVCCLHITVGIYSNTWLCNEVIPYICMNSSGRTDLRIILHVDSLTLPHGRECVRKSKPLKRLDSHQQSTEEKVWFWN